jgi:glycogen operon protein
MWLRADGEELTEADWFDDERRTLGMWIDGSDVRSASGGVPPGDSWLLVLHAGHSDVGFTLPDAEYGKRYQLILDTTHPDGAAPADPGPHPAGTTVALPARTLHLYRTLP